MTPMESKDFGELRMLAGLPAHEPDRRCRERIRAQCHAAILAKRRRAEGRPWRLVLEHAVVAVVCAVYLSEVVRRAMALYGF